MKTVHRARTGRGEAIIIDSEEETCWNTSRGQLVC